MASSVAEDYGLYPIYKEEFHSIYEQEAKEPEYAGLLKTMKVVDQNGESAMDEEQWEAASMLSFFVILGLGIQVADWGQTCTWHLHLRNGNDKTVFFPDNLLFAYIGTQINVLIVSDVNPHERCFRI